MVLRAGARSEIEVKDSGDQPHPYSMPRFVLFGRAGIEWSYVPDSC
jgi:hypothetical protein